MGRDAWVMAGGLDTFDWLKDRIKRPKVVIDLSQVSELRGMREVNGGLEIGATTTLTEVVRHPVVREKYSIFSTGAEAAASPQIRNQGTIGGNVSQDARCWYYRGGWKCYRAGGNICFADTPTAINREHAILGADRCVAVNPSDSAPALIALEAQMVIRNYEGRARGGCRRLFHRACHRHHPHDGAETRRSADRDSHPRHLGRRAILFRKSPRPPGLGFPADECRLRHGGYRRQHRAHPHRGERCRRSPASTDAVEDAVRGQPRNAATGEMGGKMAIAGAQPLRYNGYKIPLMRNLVKRAISGVEEAKWA